MDLETLPDWLQAWIHAEVAAGRAASPEDVVLTGDMVQRAQAWLEDRITRVSTSRPATALTAPHTSPS